MRRTLSMLALAAISGCGAGLEAAPAGPPAADSEPASQSCSDSTVRFVRYPKTIDALVAESTVVVIGEIVDVETGAAEGPSDERTQPRFLTVAVQRSHLAQTAVSSREAVGPASTFWAAARSAIPTGAILWPDTSRALPKTNLSKHCAMRTSDPRTTRIPALRRRIATPR